MIVVRKDLHSKSFRTAVLFSSCWKCTDFAPFVVSSTLVITILEYMSTFETSNRVNSKFGRDLYNVLAASADTSGFKWKGLARTHLFSIGESCKKATEKLSGRDGEIYDQRIKTSALRLLRTKECKHRYRRPNTYAWSNEFIAFLNRFGETWS